MRRPWARPRSRSAGRSRSHPRGRRWRASPQRWARRAANGPRPRRNRCRARSSSGTDGSWDRPYSPSRLDSHPASRAMGRMRLLLLAAVAAVTATFPAVRLFAETPPVTQTTTTSDDPYLWLEDIHGERAMTWVDKENARSLAVLKGDPRYEALHQDALKIVNATDRVPAPELVGATVYNFWQDPTNVRGLWRRTTPASYATATPAWETVLDLDQLSADEKANWVWHGADCPPPHYRRCLIALSDGGEDADTVREFDPTTKSFVDGGFTLPRSRQDIAWLDDDTLILARDWGPGTMTASNYAFVVKLLKRGQSLDQATEVYRGKPDDVLVAPSVLHDADGDTLTLITRAKDFYHSETYQLTPKGVVR